MRQFTNSLIQINHHHLVMHRTHSPEKAKKKEKGKAKESSKEASMESPATREGRPMESREESMNLTIVDRLSGTAVTLSLGIGTANVDGTGSGTESKFIPMILDDLPLH